MNYKFNLIAFLAVVLGYINFSMAQPVVPGNVFGEKIHIQRCYGLDTLKSLADRVERAMPETFESFRAAGMNPSEHVLTAIEKKVVADAFAGLPQLYQMVLKDHLHSISFMDDMPNTALTSPLNIKDTFRLYNITFRAAILHQTVSQWLTWKERTCFDTTGSGLSISIKAGKVSALTYVLMHEATHVLDLSLGILPIDKPGSKANTGFAGDQFFRGIWTSMATTDRQVNDSLLLKNRFHSGGKVLPVTAATQVYKALANSPFVSLYSTASWNEDLAEYMSVYHLTQVLKEPFQILIYKKGKQIFRYEPMKSKLVRNRARIVREFYM